MRILTPLEPQRTDPSNCGEPHKRLWNQNFIPFYHFPTRYSIPQFSNRPVVLWFIQWHFFGYMHTILASACGNERKLWITSVMTGSSSLLTIRTGYLLHANLHHRCTQFLSRVTLWNQSSHIQYHVTISQQLANQQRWRPDCGRIIIRHQN